jgi:hypothetical protein
MEASYRTHLRSMVGPVCIGVSVWCAAGVLSVASADAVQARLVSPAPWWVLLAGVVIAGLVPAWRRHPVTALPALMASLPWWPIPLPASALIWTGPLAWAPIIAAVGAASGSHLLGRLGRALGAHAPQRATWIAAALTLLLGGLTLWSLAPRLPGGDEPHYLVITQSLWLDGDLRIENNHTRRDYAEYFGGTLRPDYINRGQDREIYSIHAPGVSALVLPGFVLAGLVGAQLTILLCLAVMGAFVWRASWRATDDAAAAWFAWAAVVGTATSLLLGVMVFPDGPAAAAVAVGLYLLARLARDAHAVTVTQLVVGATALAFLPWLHTRFALLAAGLGASIVAALWLAPGRPRAQRWRRTWQFLSVPAVSAVGWFLSFWLIYGSVDPRAPYRGAESLREWIWGAVAGLFADQQFGLLAFSPVVIAAVIGACRAATRPVRLVCVASVVSVVGYTIAVASYHMWWAGLPGLPARFLTAALPLLAVPLAVGWRKATSGGRAVLLALLSVSWLITALVIAHDHGAFAFNYRDGQAAWLEWLSPVANLPRAWPSFFWGTEGAFLAHVGIWIAVWAVGWVALRALVRRHVERADIGRVAVAVWLLVCVMGSAEAGWWLTGVNGLDPARSQLALLQRDRTWRVAPGAVSQSSAAPVIRPDEAPLSDRPTGVVMAVGPVPAGSYRVEWTADDGPPAQLSARVGRSAPLFAWLTTDGSAQDVVLPAGAAVLSLQVEPVEAAARIAARLIPLEVHRRTGGTARASADYADGRTYFLDDNVFVEPAGYWVRGGRQAHVIVWRSGAVAGTRLPLSLRNGGAANVVTIRVDGWSHTLNLEPWQEAMVELPHADALGSWPLTIHSASGFQPSASGDSQDTRYLGVWVGR